MNKNRNRGRGVKHQAERKHPNEWQRDLNPNHLAGQNIGVQADPRTEPERTAFHLRKAGLDLGGGRVAERRDKPAPPNRLIGEEKPGRE